MGSERKTEIIDYVSPAGGETVTRSRGSEEYPSAIFL